MDKKDLAQAALGVSAPAPGDRFRHYKGGEYEVVACAVKEDTLELLVIYKSLAKGTLWARTLYNWSEDVEVGGQRVGRFTRIAV